MGSDMNLIEKIAGIFDEANDFGMCLNAFLSVSALAIAKNVNEEDEHIIFEALRLALKKAREIEGRDDEIERLQKLFEGNKDE